MRMGRYFYYVELRYKWTLSSFRAFFFARDWYPDFRDGLLLATCSLNYNFRVCFHGLRSFPKEFAVNSFWGIFLPLLLEISARR